MIIRNGFVRDYDGDWYNLHHIIRFNLDQLINKKWAVYALIDHNQSYIRLSPEFESKEEGYLYLDHVFSDCG